MDEAIASLLEDLAERDIDLSDAMAAALINSHNTLEMRTFYVLRNGGRTVAEVYPAERYVAFQDERTQTAFSEPDLNGLVALRTRVGYRDNLT